MQEALSPRALQVPRRAIDRPQDSRRKGASTRQSQGTAEDSSAVTVPAVKFSLLPEADRKERLAGVLQRYEHDAKMADLAVEQGCTTTTLYRWLIRECPEEWKAVQSAKAAKALEDAKEHLEDATDSLEINRAEKQIKAAQWELERLHARIYGQQEQATASVVLISIGIGPRSAERPPIDADKI